MTRQDNIIQDKTRQDNPRQRENIFDITIKDNIAQYKATHGNIRHAKTI